MLPTLTKKCFAIPVSFSHVKRIFSIVEKKQTFRPDKCQLINRNIEILMSMKLNNRQKFVFKFYSWGKKIKTTFTDLIKV